MYELTPEKNNTIKNKKTRKGNKTMAKLLLHNLKNVNTVLSMLYDKEDCGCYDRFMNKK